MLDQDPRANASLLLVEIGNSHVSVATVVEGHVADPGRFALRDDAVISAAAAAWSSLSPNRNRAMVMASVVPDETARLEKLLTAELGVQPSIIGRDIPAPLEVVIEQPQSVGVDRLCGCAAAYDHSKEACAVASFGTAITIDCVDADGRFRGGAILPGLATQAWSLHARTAQLPEVTIAGPGGAFGQDTTSAILSGIVYGAIGALREVVERFATELRRWPKLVITGGHGQLIRDHCDFVDVIVPDLVLRGMLVAHRRQYRDAE